MEEILHIRGFAELLEGVNLEAAFTIYGNNRTVVAVNGKRSLKIDPFQQLGKAPDVQDLFHGIQLGIVARRVAGLQRLVVILFSAIEPLEIVQA